MNPDTMWDPADGPAPNAYDGLDEWSDDDWQAWYDRQPVTVLPRVPQLRTVIDINPHPYL